MIAIERILFPTDLSQQSLKTLPFVKSMACRFHAEVSLLHVLESPLSMYSPAEAMAWANLVNIDEIRETRRSAFERFGAQELEGVSVRREFAEGDPAAEINYYVRKNNIHLIMMPTRGYGTFRSLLIGSVTAKVLHDAHCPVWTGVHTEETQSVNACRRILCAVDADFRDVPVIIWANDFGKLTGAEVQLFHAVPELEAGRHPSDAERRESLLNAAHRELEEMQNEASVKLAAVIRGGRPDWSVRNQAEDVHADLIIIGRGEMQKPFGRLRSAAYSIIRSAPCPVISV